MTKDERNKMPPGSMQEIELSWLYKPNFKDDVDRWVASRMGKDE
jgi:hypothetical protein